MAGNAARKLGSRPKPKHGPKGTNIGGQFIGPKSIALALAHALTASAGTHAAPAPGAPTAPRALGSLSRPTLLARARKGGISVPRGASNAAIVALLTGGSAGPTVPSPSPGRQVKSAAKKMASAKTAPSPALPSGHKRIAANVAGVSGVTSVQLPVKPGIWGAAKQSLDIHLGGVKIGTMDLWSGGYWIGQDANGNGLGVGTGSTKTAVIHAMVAKHQANLPPTSKVPGVTLHRLPRVFGNAPSHYEIRLNGVDVGGVHGDDSDPTSTWTPFPPTNSPWQLQTPGAKATRDDAIKELVDSYNTHANPSASMPSGFTTSPAPNYRSSSLKAFKVTHNGTDIGDVHDTGNGWQADATFGAWQPMPATHLYPTKTHAVHALATAYNQHLAPPASPSVSVGPIKLSRVPHMPSGSPSTYLVTAGGKDIGRVEGGLKGWQAHPPSGATWTLTGPGGITPRFKSRKAAVDALSASYAAHLTAQAAPPPPKPRGVDPAVKAAQDILYGVDPQGKTAARQLSVYGSLRTAQFNSLDSLEQSTLMGDLAYIATTSKGANGTKAQKIIDRFAPPGTPPGTIPKHASMPPGGAVGAQTRVSDPTGSPGMLKMKSASQRGQSGDGFTRTATGGSGPWGHYGAAGLMLRHVDPATGEERFLMVERGPGISDPGKWQFPGGAKEEKETFYEGAAREFIEELGLTQADLDTARVHGTHSSEVPTVQVQGLHGGRVPWAYVSIAATVPTRLKPDLSSHHARMETSDAKWMTRAEIEALDRNGKLLKPLTGGQLQQNVMSLFPPTRTPIARPGSRTTRPARLTGTPSAPKLPSHKPSRAVHLIPDKASIDALRQEVKKGRKAYAGKAADDRLAVIGAKQGFDETPTVVSKDDFDALLATGDYIEVWRGVSGAGASYRGPGRGGQITSTKTAAQVNEDLRSGPAWYGHGMFGNGYYFAADRSIAKGYSDGTRGSLLRALLPKKARVEPHRTMRSGASSVASPYTAVKNSYEEGTLYDEGRYAAALGVDAIEVAHGTPSASHVTAPGRHTYVVLNRSILIVEA